MNRVFLSVARTEVGERKEWLLIIIIMMYIYRALINTLSTHIIHNNINMILCTHVEHSPIKNNLHKVIYGNAHTHTHTHTHRVCNVNEFECVWLIRIIHHTCACAYTHTCTHAHARTEYDCSRNWALILAGVKILWEEEGFQFGFKRWQCLRSCGSEFQIWGPKKERVW